MLVRQESAMFEYPGFLILENQLYILELNSKYPVECIRNNFLIIMFPLSPRRECDLEMSQ